MRRWVLIAGVLGLGAALAAALAFAVHEDAPDTVITASTEEVQTERLLLAVDTLTCGSCETRIREALSARPGVRGVGVNLARRTVTVEYDPRAAEPRALAAAVSGAGYPARFLGLGAAVLPLGKASPSRGSGCGGSCCST